MWYLVLRRLIAAEPHSPKGTNMQQDQFTIDHLRDLGFIGFVPLASLPKGCRSLPAEPGVYVVVRDPASAHGYLDRSGGGRFKGQDGTVDVPTLSDAWVPG